MFGVDSSPTTVINVYRVTKLNPSGVKHVKQILPWLRCYATECGQERLYETSIRAAGPSLEMQVVDEKTRLPQKRDYNRELSSWLLQLDT
eukprot:5104562-Amphidinium_carterae.1